MSGWRRVLPPEELPCPLLLVRPGGSVLLPLRLGGPHRSPGRGVPDGAGVHAQVARPPAHLLRPGGVLLLLPGGVLRALGPGGGGLGAQAVLLDNGRVHAVAQRPPGKPSTLDPTT